jgi:hypothetical protein
VRHHRPAGWTILFIKPLHLIELKNTCQWDGFRGQRLSKPYQAVHIPHEDAFGGGSLMECCIVACVGSTETPGFATRADQKV